VVDVRLLDDETTVLTDCLAVVRAEGPLALGADTLSLGLFLGVCFGSTVGGRLVFGTESSEFGVAHHWVGFGLGHA
jgi:hypothetical protein